MEVVIDELLPRRRYNNGKKCSIRNAVGDDAKEVLDVFLLTHEQTDFLSSYKDDTSFDVECEREFLTNAAHSEKEVFLCAVMDGQIIGTASVFPIGENKIGHRAELGIAIDRGYWGLGIGQALTAACIECAKGAGYAQLELEAVSDNSGAMALYRKMGFVEFGRNPRGFYSRFQGFQELISMRLELY